MADTARTDIVGLPVLAAAPERHEFGNRPLAAVVGVDLNGTIVQASDSITEVLGWAPDEVVGESLLLIIPPRFHDAHTSGFDGFVRGGELDLAGQTLRLPGFESTKPQTAPKWCLTDFARVVKRLVERCVWARWVVPLWFGGLWSSARPSQNWVQPAAASRIRPARRIGCLSRLWSATTPAIEESRALLRRTRPRNQHLRPHELAATTSPQPVRPRPLPPHRV